MVPPKKKLCTTETRSSKEPWRILWNQSRACSLYTGVDKGKKTALQRNSNNKTYSARFYALCIWPICMSVSGAGVPNMLDPHNYSPAMPWEVMEWNIARPHPHSDRQCRQQLPGKNGLSGSIGFFFASGGKTARAHTHVVFSISQWASGFTPPAKACFYRWGSYGIIMLRKMGWSEVTNQSPLFWSYFVSIIYLVYHSQAFKVKFNQSPGAGPDASIPLHMGCPSDFHGVFVGDLAAEILKILKVCIQLDTES